MGEAFRPKEAMRQVELRLGAQAATLAAYEARAIAIIGWSMAGITAGGAAVLSSAVPPLLGFAAAVLVSGLAFAASSAALVLLPRRAWGVQGHRPDDVLRGHGETEADLLTWLAEGSAAAAADNTKAINACAYAMRMAVGGLLLAPAAALAVAAIVWAASAAG